MSEESHIKTSGDGKRFDVSPRFRRGHLFKTKAGSVLALEKIVPDLGHPDYVGKVIFTVKKLAPADITGPKAFFFLEMRYKGGLNVGDKVEIINADLGAIKWPRVKPMYHGASRTAAGKYDHIDFKPPKGVAEEAAKGLEYRQKASPSNRGGLTNSEAAEEGIGSGVQRAVNLKNRDNVTPETINKMLGFFARHKKNKGIKPENKGTPWNDKGHVSWLLWGGDSGLAFAEKVKKQMDAADAKQASSVARQFIFASENEPTDPSLWDKIQALAKGEKSFVEVDGKKIQGPNEGTGFKKFPTAYANGWASKIYGDLGGGWKKKARGKAKKDVGQGGLDEWFSGHGGAKGKGEEATWGDWVSISPVTKTLPSGKKVQKGDIVGDCGISSDPDWKEETKDGKNPLKCMPRQKAYDMKKSERAEKAKAKQKAEKATPNSKKPTKTETFEKAAALPLMSPLYNMREVCKQIVLLEDHLNQTEKRCPDCISKHFITIEALIEEGLSLDKDGKYRDKLEGRASRIRSLQSGWASGNDPAQIAQELRALRKEWLPGCFDIQKVGGSILMVADRFLGTKAHFCERVSEEMVTLVAQVVGQDLLSVSDDVSRSYKAEKWPGHGMAPFDLYLLRRVPMSLAEQLMDQTTRGSIKPFRSDREAWKAAQKFAPRKPSLSYQP